MDDDELRAKLETILGFCQLNFVEIHHLKNILRRHLKIDEDLGLYKRSLDEYLKRLETSSLLLTKALEERTSLAARKEWPDPAPNGHKASLDHVDIR
jgi:hypothetical protein